MTRVEGGMVVFPWRRVAGGSCCYVTAEGVAFLLLAYPDGRWVVMLPKSGKHLQGRATSSTLEAAREDALAQVESMELTPWAETAAALGLVGDA